MAVRTLLVLAALVGGCSGATPVAVAHMPLMVTTDDVFVPAGTGNFMPATASSDANANLFTKLGLPLGSPGKGMCRSVDVYWLPTSTADVPPTLDRRTSMCSLAGAVTAGSWRAASGNAIFLRAGDEMRVRVEASGLVPNGLYTAWLLYSKPGQPPFAIAPLGGLPNVMFADSGGQAALEHAVSPRLLRKGSLLLDVVSSQPNPTITDDTTLSVAVYFHSNAQTHATRVPGQLAVLDGVGYEAHRQLIGSIAALP